MLNISKGDVSGIPEITSSLIQNYKACFPESKKSTWFIKPGASNV